MTKDYYEFLFTMRSSGLVHNTPDYLSRQTAMAYFGWNSDYRILADKEGNLIAGNNDNGEVGSLSGDMQKNMRNAVISTASILPIIADAEHVNMEEAYLITDYYVNHADEIKTMQEFNQCMRQLFADFQELVKKTAHPSYGLVIDRTIDYINQNLYSRLKLIDIAEQLGYTPAYLSELFAQKTGQHLQEYIIEQKIDEVKKLLRFSSRTCTEIADALGYSSLSHLSAAFKQQTGMTLREYKFQQRNTW
jgi:AraC-like DNA-binding protein